MGSGLDRMSHTLLCGSWFNLYLLVSWKPSLRTIFYWYKGVFVGGVIVVVV